MNKIINVLIPMLQLGFTLILTASIYMIFAVLDYDGGLDNFIGLAIFQPIIALVLSGATIVLCFVIGLPIRISKNIKQWWTDHFYNAIGLTLTGMILIVLSIIPQFTVQTHVLIDGHKATKLIPHYGLVMSGWFLTSFGALHTFPPIQLLDKTKDFLFKRTREHDH